MKALEDLVLKYDGTVRSSNETIIQFKYGEDGLDPLFMDDQKLPVSLGRLWRRIKQSYKGRNDRMLDADEIMKLAENVESQCPVKQVSKGFIEKLK